MDSYPFRILFVDNDLDLLQTRAEFLENGGYVVWLAQTQEAALEILQSRHIHLMILDIRMRDDTDEWDTSGLTLAKEPRLRHIPKIILTNYPSYQYVREERGPALEGLPPAVDFISKRDGAEVMLAAVAHTIDNYVNVNPTLQFSWDAYLSFDQLLHLVQPGLTSTVRGEHVLAVEDVFRRLFRRYHQVTFGQIMHHEAGRLLVALSGFDADGRETQYIVSFGLPEALAGEIERYATAVPEQAKGFLARWEVAYGYHYTAVAYSFNGGDLERTASLGQLFRRNDTATIQAGLTHLYQTQLPLWHGRGRTSPTTHSLEGFLAEQLKAIDQKSGVLAAKVTALCRQTLATNLADIDAAPQQLTLRSSTSTYFWPNPAHKASQLDSLSLTAVHWGLIHGQVQMNKVLIGERGNAWLIDYAYAQQAPILLDFVSLEMSILLEAIPGQDIDQTMYLEHVLSVTELTAPLQAATEQTPAQQIPVHLLHALNQIRQAAVNDAGCSPTAYEAVRYYYALCVLHQFDPAHRYRRQALMPYLRALVSAAIMAQKLWPEDSAVPSYQPEFWLDEAREALWVHGQQIELTLQEYQIIALLAANNGQTCERRDIVEKAMGELYDDTYGQDDSRLNSAMSRLRQKIEPDPDNPRYLKTVRGRGYRLELPTHN